ncbi:unnamed protein product [Spirodela intermedia]|uniref:Zinc finger PHD-type domain-containing protein n=1 Tax=Spirodela intermedia TaxID=51605 RepID=A0A7I8J5M6_SPIIN|nr:unnamed protein product [Spirodela intermedia]CAA6664732.1 unnamed protein product [Spirodela intermedia]
MMHTANGTSRKRMRGDRILRLKTFCDPGHPVNFKGSSFRENVSSLLEFGCRAEGWNGPGTNCWTFQLEVHRNPPACISLFVVEELVEMSDSLRCHHCTSIGWGRHMVCNKRYHFVLPSKKTLGRSNGPNCEVRETSLLAAVGESRLMSVRGELMHGVVHSNGFGHLLAVNGFEAGSEVLSGHQILDLWDRMCTGLGIRKVSLTDTARKRGMELRLVHAVAYGEPWFARWGYRFGRESYGVTLQMYQRSIEALRCLPLCLLVPQYGTTSRELPAIIAKYQAIAGHSLVSLGQLFMFMMELKDRLPPDAFTTVDYHRITMEPACRWSTKRLEMAAQVIVDALKRANFKWVSRQDVRDAARAYVGDTGLLDFVLKSLGNHVVGNYVVRRMVNPVTKILEYCLEDVPGGNPSHCSHSSSGDTVNVRMRMQTTRVQVRKDLIYLYKCILLGQNLRPAAGIFTVVPTAVRYILDTKHLLKDYRKEITWENAVMANSTIKLLCTVCVRNRGEQEELSQPVTPYEVLTFPGHATLGDIKTTAERTFKEIYLGLKTFTSESIVDVACGDSELILGTIESGNRVVVSGLIVEGDGGQDMYEGGNGIDGLVNCACGVKEDDGERMLNCDFCNVWQHTRCVGIGDGKSVPPFFLCTHCENGISLLPSLLP